MWHDQETPLVGLTTAGQTFSRGAPDRVVLAEQPFPALINLRGEPADQDFMSGAGQVLGLALPVRANTIACGTAWTAMWLGPNEWLLRACDQPSFAAPTITALEAALQGRFFAVTDQSSGYSVLQLSGPRASDVLSKGCPLDLHPSVLPLGTCAQSLYFKAGILLRRIDEDEAWEVIVRRSFADSAARMLLDAMEEYLSV